MQWTYFPLPKNEFVARHASFTSLNKTLAIEGHAQKVF
jgi:hypothetical protein